MVFGTLILLFNTCSFVLLIYNFSLIYLMHLKYLFIYKLLVIWFFILLKHLVFQRVKHEYVVDLGRE